MFRQLDSRVNFPPLGGCTQFYSAQTNNEGCEHEYSKARMCSINCALPLYYETYCAWGTGTNMVLYYINSICMHMCMYECECVGVCMTLSLCVSVYWLSKYICKHVCNAHNMYVSGTYVCMHTSMCILEPYKCLSRHLKSPTCNISKRPSLQISCDCSTTFIDHQTE